MKRVATKNQHCKIEAQPHGTTRCYSRGCRRPECRAAWRDYIRARRGGLRPKAPKVEQRPKRDYTYYRGKVSDPLTLALTPLGREILRAAQARTDRSRGDVVEHLLRVHGATVEFTEQHEGTAA